MISTERKNSSDFHFQGVGPRVWKWLVTIVVDAFATLLGTYSLGLLNEVFPPAGELACQLREWWARDAKPVAGPKFTILVSQLDRDTDGSQTRHVVYALERQAALEVITTCKMLRIETNGALLSKERIEAERLGRQWLENNVADLLIWGEVTKADQRLLLRFTSPENSRTPNNRHRQVGGGAGCLSSVGQV
jgi:hypothetical protein